MYNMLHIAAGIKDGGMHNKLVKKGAAAEVAKLLCLAHNVTDKGVFQAALHCVKRDIETLDEHGVAAHFHDQYGLGSTNSRWALASAAPGWPTSNNGTESCNRDLKESLTERQKLPLLRFIDEMVGYLQMRSREEVSTKRFLNSPEILPQHWEEAVIFSESEPCKLAVPGSDGCFLVPSAQTVQKAATLTEGFPGEHFVHYRYCQTFVNCCVQVHATSPR
jgi:hypothetical protein